MNADFVFEEELGLGHDGERKREREDADSSKQKRQKHVRKQSENGDGRQGLKMAMAEKEENKAAWSFKEAAEEAAAERATHGTTIDDKIRKRKGKLAKQKVNGKIIGNGNEFHKTDHPSKAAGPIDDDLEADDMSEDDDMLSDDEENVGHSDEIVGFIDENYFETGTGVKYDAKTFDELELSKPLLRACNQLGYSKPTPIQSAVVPLAMAGRDISASATTGSGKTAAYALPLLERLLHRSRRHPMIHILILTPTRELAVQVQSMIANLGEFTDVRSALVVGGMSATVQMSSLRSEPEIVIATPGRLIDHLHNSRDFGLEDLSVLVLDEADRLLELGFKDELKELLRLCPRQRQTLLFSATMTDEVQKLADLSLSKPIRLAADPRGTVPKNLQEEVVRIRKSGDLEKEPVLLALCSRAFRKGTIVFTQTKQQAHRLKIIFGLASLSAAELHGNLTQAMRLQALESFRKGEVSFLIATNVAARGLDILGVESVINFDAPRTLTEYLHRVGRTARAGRSGHSVTLVEEKDRSLLKLVVKRAGGKIKQRAVAGATVVEMKRKIDSMSDHIVAIQREEREEKALRKAEMEATKALNMVDHEREIYSRPKKTWFLTEKQKKSAARAAKDLVNRTDADGDILPQEETKEKRPRYSKAMKEEEDEDSKQSAFAHRKVKAIKSAANRLRSMGAKSRIASREANLDAKFANAKKRSLAKKAKFTANADGDLYHNPEGKNGMSLMGSKGNLAYAELPDLKNSSRTGSVQKKAATKKSGFKSARRFKRRR